MSLVVAANATKANWYVRLEDVDWTTRSNGRNVTLITGVAINGAFRFSRDDPQPLVPMEYYTLTAQLHFTAWRFMAGHGVRVAITNSAPRMSWPSPIGSMSTYIKINDLDSYIQLPIIPEPENPIVPGFTKIPYFPPSRVCPYGFNYPDVFREREIFHLPFEQGDNGGGGDGGDGDGGDGGGEREFGFSSDGGDSSRLGEEGSSWYFLQNAPYAFNAFGNMVVAYLAQNMTLHDDEQPGYFSWNGYALHLIARNLR